MLYSESNPLQHYLANFTVYTLGAVAMIYGAFWYYRQKLGKAQRQPHAPVVPVEAPVAASPPPPPAPLGMGSGLEIESVLPMENQQSLYVLRAGRERFLLSVSGDKTALLSKLESAAVEQATPAYDPWFNTPKPVELPQMSAIAPRPTVSRQFMKSLEWLVSARSGSTK